MENSIENTFKPSTVNEVLLLNRIEELKIQQFKYNTGLAYFYSKNDAISVSSPPPITLRLAASAECEDCEFPKGIKIRTQSYGHGPLDLGYQYYMSDSEIQQIRWTGGAQLLSLLHDRLIRSLAAKINELSKSR